MESSGSWSGLALMTFAVLMIFIGWVLFYKCRNYRNQRPHEDDADGDVDGESHEAKVTRYNNCGLSEASDPDFWMELRHFREEDDPPVEDEADVQAQVRFEDLHVNQEVALLMVLQMLFSKIDTIGRTTAWRTLWQLKQLLKVGVLAERRDLIYSGLKSLNGDYTGFLDDDTVKAVYEPRTTYQGDFADLTSCLTRRYMTSHGFDGETQYREVLGFLRDLDFQDLEQKQFQIDRDNDPSRHAVEQLEAARGSAIATLEAQIAAARDRNDLERVEWLRERFDHLYVL